MEGHYIVKNLLIISAAPVVGGTELAPQRDGVAGARRQHGRYSVEGITARWAAEAPWRDARNLAAAIKAAERQERRRQRRGYLAMRQQWRQMGF